MKKVESVNSFLVIHSMADVISSSISSSDSELVLILRPSLSFITSELDELAVLLDEDDAELLDKLETPEILFDEELGMDSSAFSSDKYSLPLGVIFITITSTGFPTLSNTSAAFK